MGFAKSEKWKSGVAKVGRWLRKGMKVEKWECQSGKVLTFVRSATFAL
jgi:hypothetical protein